jgi:methionine--tRNA ligase beta chain
MAEHDILAHSRSDKVGTPRFLPLDISIFSMEYRQKNPLKCHILPFAHRAGGEMITIEDFAKIELKIGEVLEAKRIEGSNKLIVMKVDTGEERQLVAGIGKAYSPDELIGKKIVVVTNLQPARLMGVESHGMLLAASDDEGGLSIIIPERQIKKGSKVK